MMVDHIASISSAVKSGWMVILCLLLGICSGCKEDAVTTTAAARNVISGVADGIAFSSTNLAAIKDSSNVFLMVGTLGNSGSILAAFNGREEREYEIAQEGALVALTTYLDDLIASDSFFVDTIALQQIFSDSAQLLPSGTAYIFYIPDETPFFSRRGNITLTTFDGTINRIYGMIEGEFINADEGPKYINAAFEDIFYLDCPVATDCGI